MATKEEKSIARSIKSSISLSDILLKEGANVLLPGSGAIYEIGKVLFNHSKNYIKDRTEERLQGFHQILLSEVNEEDIKEVINTKFDIDDYHKLLSCCVNDIENEKTQSYSTFLKNLILSKCSVLERRHFIRLLNEFTFYDLEFLRKIYINQKFDLMTIGGTSQQLEQITRTENSFELVAFKKFTDSGLLTKKDSSILLTDLGLKFVELVHTKIQLHPESIGKQCFKNITIYILTFELSKDSNHSTFSSWLQKELWNKQVKCSIGTIRKSTHLMWAMHFDAFFILQGDNEFDPMHITKLAKFSKHIQMVRINTTEKAKEQIFNGVKMHSEYNINLINLDKAIEQAINMLDTLIA